MFAEVGARLARNSFFMTAHLYKNMHNTFELFYKFGQTIMAVNSEKHCAVDVFFVLTV